MTKIIISFFLYLLISLQIFSQHGNDVVLDFEDFLIKNTSIRAIEIIDDTSIWFAGSNGIYGKIINGKVQIDSINKENGKNLNFRSIAFNGKDIFLLSIENPAILYKINPFKKNAKPIQVYRESHPKVFYDSMKFINESNGIAMGDPTGECLSVITTSDAGNTWKKIKCEDLPKIFKGEAAFAASNTNISIYNNNVWMVSGGMKSRIFHSIDFGKTWKVYQTPVVQGKNMTGIFSVDFYDENYGIIMGGNWEEKSNFNATKALTIDGGKTWELVADHKAPGYISCVQYVPGSISKKIIAVSTEGIYYSNNSGKSWKKISDKKYFSIKFVNKNTAWLSGIGIISKITIN